MTRAIVIAIAIAACSKGGSSEETASGTRPTMPTEEAQRARDACKAYVEQVCACAQKLPALAEECRLARAEPEGVQLLLDTAASPETSRRDALQALAAVRKTVKHCIEATAKLPTAGCR